MSTLLYCGEHPVTSNGLWGLRHQVADLDRATDFYVQQLGFRLNHQSTPHTRQLSSGGLNLILTSVEASNGISNPGRCECGSGHRNRIVLHVQNLASLIKNLKRAGMNCAKEMEVSPDGKHIQFEDPDGNPVELFEPCTAAGHVRPVVAPIEDWRQFLCGWLLPIVISFTFFALIYGTAFLLMR
jgi:glyoxylase I family protein